MSKPVTDCALEWFIASVCSHVYLQPILSRIIFAAENAWITLLGDCIPNLGFEYELTVNPLHFVTIIAISSVLLILNSISRCNVNVSFLHLANFAVSYYRGDYALYSADVGSTWPFTGSGRPCHIKCYSLFATSSGAQSRLLQSHLHF